MVQTRRPVITFLMVSRNLLCTTPRSLSCWWCTTGEVKAALTITCSLSMWLYICLCAYCCVFLPFTVLRLPTMCPQGRGKRLWREPPSLMLLWPTSLPGCVARKRNEIEIHNVCWIMFCSELLLACAHLWGLNHVELSYSHWQEF